MTLDERLANLDADLLAWAGYSGVNVDVIERWRLQVAAIRASLTTAASQTCETCRHAGQQPAARPASDNVSSESSGASTYQVRHPQTKDSPRG